MDATVWTDAPVAPIIRITVKLKIFSNAGQIISLPTGVAYFQLIWRVSNIQALFDMAMALKTLTCLALTMLVLLIQKSSGKIENTLYRTCFWM